MIDYLEVNKGDILKLVGKGAPGYAKLGDLLIVTGGQADGVNVEDRQGKPMQFVYGCGAERLEPTEWKNDFPVETVTD